MKNILLGTITAVALMGASMTTASAGFFEDWQEWMNSEPAKAAYLDELCSSSDILDQNRCVRYKRDGVPDSDVMLPAIILGAGVGALAGVGVFHLYGGTLAAGSTATILGETVVLGTAASYGAGVGAASSALISATAE